jgi:hypothetical protein
MNGTVVVDCEDDGALIRARVTLRTGALMLSAEGDASRDDGGSTAELATARALLALAARLVAEARRSPDELRLIMVCPNCGAEDTLPPTVSDNATTTCPKCGHRFPVEDAVNRSEC